MKNNDWPTFAGDHARRNSLGKRKGGRKSGQQLSHQKKSEHGGNLGRDMENRVEAVGLALVECGELVAFVRHELNSPEDRSGKDFTAKKLVADGEVERSFGITISGEKRRLEAQSRYPDVPQWWTPWDMRDDTIQKKILKLF